MAGFDEFRQRQQQMGFQNILGGLKSFQQQGQREETERQRAFEAQQKFDDEQTALANRQLFAKQQAAEQRAFQTEQKALDRRLRGEESRIKSSESRVERERKEGALFTAGQKKIRRSLTGKRDKIVKEFKDIDRVFGNVDSFAAKFNRGEDLTASDQFQLIRSIVPLAEINPGVVRGEEFETARSLGGKIGEIQVRFNNLRKGELLPRKVIKEMLDTTNTMRDVVVRGKEGRFSDLLEETQFEGLSEKDQDVVLGGSGRTILETMRNKLAAREQEQLEQQQAAQSNQRFFAGLGQSAIAAPPPQLTPKQLRFLELQQKAAGR